MKLSEERKAELEKLYQQFLHDERILKMKEIPMHRGSNCFLHSFRVARLCIKRAQRHKHVNYEVLLVGAILHDYYLYDWRKNRELRKKHGRNHPMIAARKAKEDFGISEEVSKIIETHMWPINFKKFPKTKEARILMNADTDIATREFMTCIKYKANKMPKYLKKIETLF